MLEGLELANEMSPAELTSAFLVVAVVSKVVVTGDDAGKGIAEEVPEHLGSSAG